MTIVSTASVCGTPSTRMCRPASSMRSYSTPASERHAALLEQRAPDPAGRLGEAFADLARLALQQPHLARPGRVDRRLQPAALAIVGVDSPFVAIFVDRVAAAVMREEFADVEADAAGADDRDARRPPRAVPSTMST